MEYLGLEAAERDFKRAPHECAGENIHLLAVQTVGEILFYSVSVWRLQSRVVTCLLIVPSSVRGARVHGLSANSYSGTAGLLTR